MICRGIHGRVPLVVSAYDVSGMKERAMAWGVCGFMSKPLCRSGVIDCMNRCRIGEELMRPDTKLVRLERSRDSRIRNHWISPEARSSSLRIMSLTARLPWNCWADSGWNWKLQSTGEALKRFEESRPGYYSLILMDIQMPVMNGYEAARAIRSLSRGRKDGSYPWQ